MPRPAASAATTTKMPSSRTILSFSPKVRIAHSLSAAGVRSTAALPTAMTGKAEAFTTPATSRETPTATAPDTRPISAAAHRGVRLLLFILRRYAPRGP